VRTTALDNQLKRMVPRLNESVNAWWMCDEGRLNIRYVNSERRLRSAKGNARELAAAAKKLGGFGIVASTYQTIEEMWLLKRLSDEWKAPVGWLTLSRGEKRSYPGLTIEPDKTPNRRFAEKLFGELKPVPRGCKGLFLMNGIPDFAIPDDLLAAAKEAEFLAVSDILKTPLADKAHVVLPALSWAEKDGTFMNVDGRVQRIRPALTPPPGTKAEVAWLQEALGVGTPLSAEGVFKQAAKEVPCLAGLEYGKLGRLGAATNGH
jgi:NADH-quinone oxidoreductase subunit G